MLNIGSYELSAEAFDEELFGCENYVYSFESIDEENGDVDSEIEGFDDHETYNEAFATAESALLVLGVHLGYAEKYSLEDGDNIFKKTWDFIVKIFKKIIDGIKAFFSMIFNFFKNLFSGGAGEPLGDSKEVAEAVAASKAEAEKSDADNSQKVLHLEKINMVKSVCNASTARIERMIPLIQKVLDSVKSGTTIDTNAQAEIKKNTAISAKFTTAGTKSIEESIVEYTPEVMKQYIDRAATLDMKSEANSITKLADAHKDVKSLESLTKEVEVLIKNYANKTPERESLAILQGAIRNVLAESNFRTTCIKHLLKTMIATAKENKKLRSKIKELASGTGNVVKNATSDAVSGAKKSIGNSLANNKTAQSLKNTAGKVVGKVKDLSKRR